MHWSTQPFQEIKQCMGKPVAAMSRRSQYKSLVALTFLLSLHLAITDAHQSRPNRSSELLARPESVPSSGNAEPQLSPHSRRPPRLQTVLLRQQQQTPGKDFCLQKWTAKNIAECLQPLLELYYGPVITVACPEASFHLLSCRGCPWDRFSPELLERNPRPNPRDYFHSAESSCKIADLYWELTNSKTLLINVFMAGTHATLLLAVLSVFGISSGSKNGVISPVTLLHWKVPEVLYLAVLWLVYISVHILLVSSSSYYLLCETPATYISYHAVVVISYATVLFISVSRCFRMSSKPKISDDDAEDSSWLSFISGLIRGQISRSRSSVMLSLWVALALLLLIIALLVDYRVPFSMGNARRENGCNMGHKDFAMGFIQISKKVLEILCVLVYASGVQRGPWRRASLVVILLCSWALLFSTIPSSGPYKQHSVSMTIPRTLDISLATRLIEIAHITFIAALGILDRFRVKILKQEEPLEP